MKKITLFIGLNDKDTKAQKYSFEAAGVYTHDDGETVQEVTIRAEFYTDDEAPVREFAKFAKCALNQESIALEVSAPVFELV